MQRVFAVNHTRQEIMAVGHESWGGNDADMKERLDIFAPRQAAGRDQFYFITDKFDVQELMTEDKAKELEYKQVSGYWG